MNFSWTFNLPPLSIAAVLLSDGQRVESESDRGRKVKVAKLWRRKISKVKTAATDNFGFQTFLSLGFSSMFSHRLQYSIACTCMQTKIMHLFHQYEDDHIFHKLKNTYFPGLYSLVGWKNIMYTEMEKLDSSQKKPGSLQGYRARCVLSAFMWRCYYWNAHYVPAGHRWYLLTANFDSEVKCCKFWTQSQHRSLPLTAIPRWSADIKGRRLWQRLRYILVCWDYMRSRRIKETIDTQRRWLVKDCKYNYKVHPEKFHHYGWG